MVRVPKIPRVTTGIQREQGRENQEGVSSEEVKLPIEDDLFSPERDGQYTTQDAKFLMYAFINEVDFPSSKNRQFIRAFPTWLATDHNDPIPFEGYNDAEFDRINVAAFRDLLGAKVSDVIPLLKEINSDGLPAIMRTPDMQERYDKLTLGDVLKGDITPLYMGVDINSDEFQKTIADLTVNSLFSEKAPKTSFGALIASIGLKFLDPKTSTQEELDKNENLRRMVSTILKERGYKTAEVYFEKIKDNIENVFRRVMSDRHSRITAFMVLFDFEVNFSGYKFHPFVIPKEEHYQFELKLDLDGLSALKEAGFAENVDMGNYDFEGKNADREYELNIRAPLGDEPLARFYSILLRHTPDSFVKNFQEVYKKNISLFRKRLKQGTGNEMLDKLREDIKADALFKILEEVNFGKASPAYEGVDNEGTKDVSVDEVLSTPLDKKTYESLVVPRMLANLNSNFKGEWNWGADFYRDRGVGFDVVDESSRASRVFGPYEINLPEIDIDPVKLELYDSLKGLKQYAFIEDTDAKEAFNEFTKQLSNTDITGSAVKKLEKYRKEEEKDIASFEDSSKDEEEEEEDREDSLRDYQLFTVYKDKKGNKTNNIRDIYADLKEAITDAGLSMDELLNDLSAQAVERLLSSTESTEEGDNFKTQIAEAVDKVNLMQDYILSLVETHRDNDGSYEKIKDIRKNTNNLDRAASAIKRFARTINVSPPNVDDANRIIKAIYNFYDSNLRMESGSNKGVKRSSLKNVLDGLKRTYGNKNHRDKLTANNATKFRLEIEQEFSDVLTEDLIDSGMEDVENVIGYLIEGVDLTTLSDYDRQIYESIIKGIANETYGTPLSDPKVYGRISIETDVSSTVGKEKRTTDITLKLTFVKTGSINPTMGLRGLTGKKTLTGGTRIGASTGIRQDPETGEKKTFRFTASQKAIDRTAKTQADGLMARLSTLREAVGGV